MEDPDRFSFLGEFICPEVFRLRTLRLQSGDAIDYLPADWADALVVVEQGELEVECCSGAVGRFGPGAVLAFAGLTVARLRNPGSVPLLLSAVSRRTDD